MTTLYLIGIGAAGYLATYVISRRYAIYGCVALGVIVFISRYLKGVEKSGYNRRKGEEAIHALDSINTLRSIRFRTRDHLSDPKRLHEDDGFKR